MSNDRKTRLIEGTPLTLMTLFQLWVIFFKSGTDLDLASRLALLPFSILMFLSPLLLAWVILFTTRRHYLSLLVTIPSSIVFLWAFYVEFLHPYQGGGASMVYAVAWAYAFIASAGCYLVYLLTRKFTN